VAEFVEQRGRATVDHLQQEFPDKPRKVLQHALENARAAGRLRIILKGAALGRGKGKLPGVWAPVPEWERERKAKPAPQRAPRVSSVWQLGSV